MKFSLHEKVRGKPVKVTGKDGRVWLEQGGVRVNLGDGWINVDADWNELFEMLTVDGCAIAPSLTSEHRSDATFDECSIALIDIDSGMTIEQLFSNPFYEAYGAGFYTTPSHTNEAHRFRIIHRLEQPVRSSETMRLLYRALMLAYGYADAACKDSARLFYGTKNCVIKEQRSNTLPPDVVEDLVKYTLAQDEQKIRVLDQTEYPPLTDQRKNKVIELLKKSFIGRYDKWRDIGWGLRSGGFALSDYQNATTGLMNAKSPEDARTVWNSYKDGNITMGTVIHFLKTRHGDDCLREEPTKFMKLLHKSLAIEKQIKKGAY